MMSFGKLADVIAVVYHFHNGVNSFSEKVTLCTRGLLFFAYNIGDL